MKQGYKYSWTEMQVLKQNWTMIAKEFNGKYKTINSESFANLSDPILKKFDLKIPFDGGRIELLTTEFKPLKAVFKFKKNLKWEFLIYPEDFTDRIGKLFGLKEVEIGDNEFDKRFIIKCQNKQKIEEILTANFKKYLISNYVANFKLESTNGFSTLELNIVINELEYSIMVDLIKLLQDCIKTLKSNLP